MVTTSPLHPQHMRTTWTLVNVDVVIKKNHVSNYLLHLQTWHNAKNTSSCTKWCKPQIATKYSHLPCQYPVPARAQINLSYCTTGNLPLLEAKTGLNFANSCHHCDMWFPETQLLLCLTEHHRLALMHQSIEHTFCTCVIHVNQSTEHRMPYTFLLWPFSLFCKHPYVDGTPHNKFVQSPALFVLKL